MNEIRRSKYVSLTTYRKDGTPVATPVWHVAHDGGLLVVTPADSWKVKRIRNNDAVTVTVCDVRGRTAPDAATASGSARLLDAEGTAEARAHLARRYVTSRVGNWFARLLHIRRKPMIGIAITLGS
ncbi:PPOX class F420-dependent oxidoreductase [Streptomyces sp. A7024]|uniref:PPOX class F420-dependent oxidoreductase n=1 Tax=Streptomyces coryli TaxID=1128680 RepID=A0A6G4UE21_9ACTN|nr:PPOX class F420-dependent oxidoreductase [Streptomyces coryli]NGN70282.1 PPOX class F420-dependent oxidoreductase [Streptomyces coryli]